LWGNVKKLDGTVICFATVPSRRDGTVAKTNQVPYGRNCSVFVPMRCYNRAGQLYKNISMLFLFPVTRDLLFTNI